MANISSAFGQYTIDFSNTEIKGNKTAQQDLLSKLADALEYTELENGEKIILSYATRFYLEEAKNLNDEYHIEFTADGRWAYYNNLDWFKNDASLCDNIKHLDGLTIMVDYTDYEFGIMQLLANASCSIEVANGKINITHSEKDWLDLTPKNYLNANIGDFGDMVNEFWLDEFDLTDGQLERIAQMDEDEFNKHWQENYKNV